MPVRVENKAPASAKCNQKQGGCRDWDWLDKQLKKTGVTLGVVCGSALEGGGFLHVVDIDDKPEGNSVAFGELWANYTNFRVRTGRGRGQHLYFRVREPFVGKSPAPFSESRGVHQYVVAPYGRHPSGATYSPIDNGEIGWMPPGLEYLCRTGAAAEPKEYTTPVNEKAAWRNYHKLMRVARETGRLLEQSEDQYAAQGIVYVKCLLSDHEVAGSKSAILPPGEGRSWSGYRCHAGKCDGKGAQDVLDALKSMNFLLWQRIILEDV